MVTILLTDDELDTIVIISSMLQQQNFVVITAHSKDEFEKQFESHKPDLIIMDLHLGLDDGRELCTNIKASNANLPIILISARPDLIHSSNTCGADAIIEKPFRFNHLVRTINELLAV